MNCRICHKQFARLDTKSRHERGCGKTKIFTCSLCLKNYSRNDNLQRHLFKVHQNAERCRVGNYGRLHPEEEFDPNDLVDRLQNYISSGYSKDHPKCLQIIKTLRLHGFIE